MANRILQFGTSRFLQAHADLFVHQARATGQDIGPITVVKTTQGGTRAGRVQAFADPAGYPVQIRGVVAGARIETDLRVTSVTRALTAQDDWPLLTEIFIHETEIVICNTGEAGYDLTASDHLPPTGIPKGFPAKLLALLIARYDTSAAPLLILPCELISENGRELRRVLTGLAHDWAEPSAFMDWLARSVTICDTLVDRIVSQPIEPIGAVAEPYALWAIQRAPGMTEPFQHPNVTYTDDLTPFLRLKLHILNLGHTWLAETWRSTGRNPDETVREILADPEILDALRSLYHDEIIPGFSACGMGEQAARYVTQTVDRFQNPYLNHRISDIAQNHALKIERRAVAFLDWVHARDPALAMPRLERLAQIV